MKPFDWFTISLLGLAAVGAVGAIAAKRRGMQSSMLKASLPFVGVALLLQFFRGFDVPVSAVATRQTGEQVEVTGTVHNPRSFTLKAIVATISWVRTDGTVESELVGLGVGDLTPGDTKSFSVKPKQKITNTTVNVTAEGFWN